MNGIPIVVPVRFAARNLIMQATSGWLSVEAVFVRCPEAPPRDAVIALRISLPGEYLPEHLEGVVGKRIPPDAQGECGFWVGFQGLPAASRRRIARFVEGRNAAMESLSRRAFPRAPMRRQVLLRWPPASDFLVAHSENISRGGIFVRTQKAPALHQVVEVQLDLPDREGSVRTRAEVVQSVNLVADDGQVGAGLQFVGADDAFRERLDRCLDHLFAAPLRTG